MFIALTPSGVAEALARISEAWPAVAKNCRIPVIRRAILENGRAVGASDDDLDRAAMWIVKNQDTVTQNTGIPKLFRKALESINIEGASRQSSKNNCTERKCNDGLLELNLDWNGPYDVLVFCPYCQAGQRRQEKTDMDTEPDTPHNRQKRAIVKAGLKDYDEQRTDRLRRERGFKYE